MYLINYLYKISTIIFILILSFSYLSDKSTYHEQTHNLKSKKKILRDIAKCNHDYYKNIIINPTEKEDGRIEYICKFCEKKYYDIIPKLDEKYYITENLNSNCQHGKGKRYHSKNNDIYEVTDDDIKLHSIYGEKCQFCEKLIGEFNFKNLGEMECPEYPRLYQLSNYWNNNWLLGGNGKDGKVYVQKSKNEGKNWTLPIVVSHYPEHICSNVALYELPNHDIISAYKVEGHYLSLNPEIRHNRKICSSISHDGGETWTNLGIIVDNFELAERLGRTKLSAIKACEYENMIGFFDPFIEKINNQITVFYADDFTTVFTKPIGKENIDNYRAQNIYSQTFDIDKNKWSYERNIIIDGTIKNSPTNSNLKKRYSRNGMPVVNTMKDGTYVLVFESTYRDKDYQFLTSSSLDYYNWNEILLSYSKDGIIWSNPVEIYIPKNEQSRARAPFVVSTENNQLIISFQTDEDSITSGYFSDINSIMKVMISKPGIDIKDINKDSFYALCNSNNSKFGQKSIWNGMMIIKNILYTCSSDNTIKYSEIPVYAEPNKYNDKLRNEYDIKSGDIIIYGNKIICKEKETLVMNKQIDTTINNTFYTYVTPNKTNDVNYNCGLIFGLNNPYTPFWTEIDHYMFIINFRGYLFLSKFENGIYSEIVNKGSKDIEFDFNNGNTYKMSVSFNPNNGKIIASINDKVIFNVIDKTLKGKNVGFRSLGNNTVFTQILIE